MKRFLAAWLPRDYREQVLGDLQERGFRLRDIASVIPQVWWSCLRRSAAVPMLASANEAALRHRAQQFQVRRFLGTAVALALLTGASWDAQAFWVALFLVSYALTFLHFSDRTPRPGREGWVEIHRKQLTQAIQSSRWGGSPAVFASSAILYRLVRSILSENLERVFPQIEWLLLLLPLSVILGRVHARRLNWELEALQ
jgi:hypothetical protein